jgi:UDP-N-acetyl-D-galactosamine dehydrogenase
VKPINEVKIAVIGLGYVGLPLAVEFSKKYPVVGFDINQKRVGELVSGHDATLEVADASLSSVLVSKRAYFQVLIQKHWEIAPFLL